MEFSYKMKKKKKTNGEQAHAEYKNDYATLEKIGQLRGNIVDKNYAIFQCSTPLRCQFRYNNQSKSILEIGIPFPSLAINIL